MITTNKGVLLGLILYCSIAILMELVRSHQHAPGGAPYGFEDLEAVAAASHHMSIEARRGEKIFGRYCAVCHGETGRGDGMNASWLDPRPASFQDDALRRRLSQPGWIVRVVREGGEAAGRSNLMPPYGLTLSKSQIQEVSAFVSHLAGQERP